MDPRAIRADTFVRTIEHRASTESTNLLATELLGDQPALPLLVTSDEQTGGRGRGGNTWWSALGALTVSVAVQREDKAVELPPYSLAVGLAVRDALQAFLPDSSVKVKWPNDVHLNDRKVCGILVEIPPERPDVLIIGIGINVNNSVTHAPKELRSTAVSMSDISGSGFDRQSVLIGVLRRIANELSDLDCRGIPERWSNHCTLTGRIVSIQRGDRVDTGRCVGVSASGAIVLTDGTAETAISSGIVTRVGGE